MQGIPNNWYGQPIDYGMDKVWTKTIPLDNQIEFTTSSKVFSSARPSFLRKR